MNEVRQTNTLLLIEDDRSIRDSLKEMLEIMGYGVLCADNADTGISLTEENNPQLILCDIMLPGKTGFDFLSEVRNRHFTTPFIFLSASAEEKKIEEGLALGADAYLTKPFNIDELISTINKLLPAGNGLN